MQQLRRVRGGLPGGVHYGGGCRAAFHDELCIGCGQCVSVCPEGAIRMELRAELPRIPATNDKLWASIRNEAIVTMVKEKVFGKKGYTLT